MEVYDVIELIARRELSNVLRPDGEETRPPSNVGRGLYPRVKAEEEGVLYL